MNKTECIMGDNGDRLWHVHLEWNIDPISNHGKGGCRAMVAVYHVRETTGAGPNVLLLLSATWADTRAEVDGIQNYPALVETAQMAADAESEYLEGWLDG